MSQTSAEVCVGCGHVISKHFNDVIGIARCLHVQRGHGLAEGFELPCACANFIDPNKTAFEQHFRTHAD